MIEQINDISKIPDIVAEGNSVIILASTTCPECNYFLEIVNNVLDYYTEWDFYVIYKELDENNIDKTLGYIFPPSAPTSIYFKNGKRINYIEGLVLEGEFVGMLKYMSEDSYKDIYTQSRELDQEEEDGV